MRLICPNCGAQYEVPDEVIPTGGRDVQCSNCGDTWFQRHLKSGASSDEDEQDAPREWEKPQAASARAEPAPEQEPTPEEPVTDPDEPDEDAPSDEFDEAADAAPPPPPPPTRRSVDPGVADILRQEAAHEQQVRASQSAGGLETQPDLGLTDPPIAADERSQQARARMERLRGEAPPPAAEGVSSDDTDDHPDIDPSSRRNLLPDIEEINSSLTSVNEHDEPTTAPIPEDIHLPKRRSGFGTGFRLSLILFVLGTLAYVFAPQIAQMLPAAEAPLDSFVDAVNRLRLALSDLVGSASGWFSDMGAPASGG